jgi:hypothetical protein
MTKHMNQIAVSYEWSPIQRNRKNQNLRHKTVANGHKCLTPSQRMVYQTRAKQYYFENPEGIKCDEESGESRSSISSHDIILSIRSMWYKYFKCFSMKKSAASRASEKQRRALCQVFVSLNDDPIDNSADLPMMS